MSNLYGSVDADSLRTQLFKGHDGLTWDHTVAPLGQGVFVKQDSAAQVGQWGMIPPSSKERTPKTREGRRISTNNARRETVGMDLPFSVVPSATVPDSGSLVVGADGILTQRGCGWSICR